MNTTQLLASLLLAAPAAAYAAPHTIVIRVSQGSEAYLKTVRVESGSQVNFVGPVGGQNMILNAVLIPRGGTFSVQYQIEVSHPGGDRTFQVQSAAVMRAGERLRAVECENQRLDLSLDAAGGSPPAWNPAGPNYRLAALVGSRRCRLTQEPGTQSNVIDAGMTNGRKSGFIFNAVLTPTAGNACKLEYQIEDSPRKMYGEEILVLGKKASAHGGKIELLLEGPASAPAATADSPSQSEEPAQQGAVRLLR